LEQVRLIFVVVPAFAHKNIANLCAPYLSSKHQILLLPGRTGGALEFADLIGTQNGWVPVISEANTYPLVSRVTGPGTVNISAIKKELPIAAFPAIRTEEVCREVKSILPGVKPAEDVLETGLSNIGAIFHPAPLLLNTGRAESTNGQYNHYLDGISPTVAKFIEQIDAERVSVGRALGKQIFTAADWLKHVYGSTGENLYECLHSTPCYQGLGAPNSLKHRYIWEDVPTGLVPIAAIGQLIDIPTPTILSTISMASHLCGCDFWKEGRNAESLGISDLNTIELKWYLREGSLDLLRYSHILEPEEAELEEMEIE
jgi:opine dehydrogenase